MVLKCQNFSYNRLAKQVLQEQGSNVSGQGTAAVLEKVHISLLALQFPRSSTCALKQHNCVVQRIIGTFPACVGNTEGCRWGGDWIPIRTWHFYIVKTNRRRFRSLLVDQVRGAGENDPEYQASGFCWWMDEQEHAALKCTEGDGVLAYQESEPCYILCLFVCIHSDNIYSALTMCQISF